MMATVPRGSASSIKTHRRGATENNLIMRRSWNMLPACLLTLSVLLSAAPSLADEGNDEAVAQALFEQGRELMDKGEYKEACSRLHASNELDAAVGTLLFLGDCYEQSHKLASAWAAFQQAASLADDLGDERREVAQIRATALKPRLTYVMFQVGAGNTMPGFELRRSGVVVPEGSWNIGVPVDADRYEVRASAPGYEAWSTTIEVPPELDNPLVVRVPKLARSADSNTPAANMTAGPVASTRVGGTVAPIDSGVGPRRAQRTWGVVLMTLGGVALAAGGVLTGLALKKNHDSKANCRDGEPTLCKPEGVAMREDARNLASLATIVGASGGGVLVAGGALFFTAPSNDEGKLSGLAVGFRSEF